MDLSNGTDDRLITVVTKRSLATGEVVGISDDGDRSVFNRVRVRLQAEPFRLGLASVDQDCESFTLQAKEAFEVGKVPGWSGGCACRHKRATTDLSTV